MAKDWTTGGIECDRQDSATGDNYLQTPELSDATRLRSIGCSLVDGKDTSSFVFAGHKKQQNQEKPSRPGPQRQKLPSANQSEKIDGLQPYGYCASMEPTQATNVPHQLHNPAVYM